VAASLPWIVGSDNAPNLGPSVATPTGPVVACRVPGMRAAAKNSVSFALGWHRIQPCCGGRDTGRDPRGVSSPLPLESLPQSSGVRTACSGPTDGAYQHALLILGPPAQQFSAGTGRRFVPPTIRRTEQQPGRERPRVLSRNVATPVWGVAHVPAAASRDTFQFGV